MAKKQSSRKSSSPEQPEQTVKSLHSPLRQKVSLEDLPVDIDPTLKLLWTDYVSFALRGDVQFATLRFFAIVGTRSIEACRVQMSQEHFRRMLDAGCRVTNYYPEKPST